MDANDTPQMERVRQHEFILPGPLAHWIDGDPCTDHRALVKQGACGRPPHLPLPPSTPPLIHPTPPEEPGGDNLSFPGFTPWMDNCLGKEEALSTTYGTGPVDA